MRYVHIVLGVLMVTFAAVQYNDPDAPLWIVIYLVPAAWAFAASVPSKNRATTRRSSLLARDFWNRHFERLGS